MKTIKRFWMVWCPQGHAPVYRHGSLESAEAEACRLAERCPSQRFYVLACVGGFQKVTVERIDITDDPSAEIPF